LLLTAKKKLMNIGPWNSIPFSGVNGLTPCLKWSGRKTQEVSETRGKSNTSNT
jgi:hypothetical protein